MEEIDANNSNVYGIVWTWTQWMGSFFLLTFALDFKYVFDLIQCDFSLYHITSDMHYKHIHTCLFPIWWNWTNTHGRKKLLKLKIESHTHGERVHVCDTKCAHWIGELKTLENSQYILSVRFIPSWKGYNNFLRTRCVLKNHIRNYCFLRKFRYCKL